MLGCCAFRSAVNVTTVWDARFTLSRITVSHARYKLSRSRSIHFRFLSRNGAFQKQSLCVVIPAFNEEPVLPQTSRALAASLDALDVEWSVVFVNDGSRDKSARVLEQLYRADHRFGYLLLSRNFGHQAALTAGLDNAEGDVIITMDADLQHPPEMIRLLLDAWREGFDVVHTRKVTTVGLTGWRKMVTPVAYSFIKRSPAYGSFRRHLTTGCSTPRRWKRYDQCRKSHASIGA